MADVQSGNIGEDLANVLRETFERELSLHDVCDWHEDILCNAYQRGLDILDGKEKSSCKESRRRKWNIGDYCRAIYADHDEYYEAKIVSIFGDYCTVEFLGYGNQEDSIMKNLTESRGRDARKMQVNEAKEEEYEDATDESVADDRSYKRRRGNQRETVRSAEAYHAPSSPMPDNLPFMSPPRPHCSCNPTPPMMPQNSASHPTPPMMPQYSACHPTPPMMPEYSGPASSPLVYSALNAWYMAGFYAGKFTAGRDNQRCQCNYNHSG